MEEELPDIAAVRAWVGQFGPFAADEVGREVGGADQDVRARVLREAIYELVLTAMSAEGIEACPSRAREAVNEVAALPVPAPWLDASGRLCWHADEPVPAFLARIARDALDLVTSAAIDRVRRCAGHDCNALFLDASRPGTRRWCSMNTCGNQAKKDTLRSRRAGG